MIPYNLLTGHGVEVTTSSLMNKNVEHLDLENSYVRILIFDWANNAMYEND